jgi:hypothetical protein
VPNTFGVGQCELCGEKSRTVILLPIALLRDARLPPGPCRFGGGSGWLSPIRRMTSSSMPSEEEERVSM